MNLFEAATEGSDTEFASHAISWLETKTGFDGLVWGSGTLLQDGEFSIAKYYLEGRAPH